MHAVGLYQAFSGQGNRLDGKCKSAADNLQVQQSHEIKRFVSHNYQFLAKMWIVLSLSGITSLFFETCSNIIMLPMSIGMGHYEMMGNL